MLFQQITDIGKVDRRGRLSYDLLVYQDFIGSSSAEFIILFVTSAQVCQVFSRILHILSYFMLRILTLKDKRRKSNHVFLK